MIEHVIICIHHILFQIVSYQLPLSNNFVEQVGGRQIHAIGDGWLSVLRSPGLVWRDMSLLWIHFHYLCFGAIFAAGEPGDRRRNLVRKGSP